MAQNWEHEAAKRVPELLGEWLGIPLTDVRVVSEPRQASYRPDLRISTQRQSFVVEVVATDGVATLDRGETLLRGALGTQGAELPLLAVPYMGPRAREWARARRASWVDLSGNADIWAEGLRIHVEGRPNLYARAGRPSNPFTPRFSRVSRALLVYTERWWKQTELASELGLPTGTVSKVVQRLLALDLLVRDPVGRVRARAPSLLLDAWAQRYRFSEHYLQRYHMVGRTGPSVQRDLAERLATVPGRWAATGLSAAWMYTQFADFRVNTFYVEDLPRDPEQLGLRPTERGENVWLVVPRDEGVFYGGAQQGHWCVHPVQAWLDLQEHPERAEEAALELRAQRMKWRA